MTDFMVVPGVHLEGRRFADGLEKGDAFQQATALAREHGAVHVTDVDAVRRNKPDVEFLRDLCRNRPVWLDTGPRDAADAMDALVAGSEHLTVRWTAVRGAAELDELAELTDPGSVRVMLEFDGTRPSTAAERDGSKGFVANGFVRNPREPEMDAGAVARVLADHGSPVVVNAPAFDAALMRRFAPAGDDAPQPWWYGPVLRAEVTELRRAGFAGVIVPVTLLEEATQGAKDAEVAPE